MPCIETNLQYLESVLGWRSNSLIFLPSTQKLQDHNAIHYVTALSAQIQTATIYATILKLNLVSYFLHLNDRELAQNYSYILEVARFI